MPGVVITGEQGPSWLGIPPSFSFHWEAYVEAQAPVAYVRAMAEWYQRITLHVECMEHGRVIWQRNKPWYCNL